MATIVEIGRHGRLTLPAAVRKVLALTEGSHLEVDVRDGAVYLRPVVTVPRDDSWAYTPEHQALLVKALADLEAGRVHAGLSPADLSRLAAVDPTAPDDDADPNATTR
jgi:AbrB family looped-hinge helix DNA binding protein